MNDQVLSRVEKINMDYKIIINWKMKQDCNLIKINTFESPCLSFIFSIHFISIFCFLCHPPCYLHKFKSSSYHYGYGKYILECWCLDQDLLKVWALTKVTFTIIFFSMHQINDIPQNITATKIVTYLGFSNLQ